MPNVNKNPFEMTSEEKDLDEIFHGEKKPLHPDTVYETFSRPATGAEKKASTNTASTAKAAQNPARKLVEKSCVDAEYEPAKPAPNWLDNLKASAKHIAIFGGLNILIFYWQQVELMDASIAIPSMCICAALAGWGVGINFTRGNH